MDVPEVVETMSRIEKMEQLARISHLGPIARRYFAMNAFDGTLTIVGIILGLHFALQHDPSAVISSGIGACLAMMFSGLAGTYLAEKAEREREFKEMERAMLRSLDQTMVKKASRFAILVSSTVDGFAPFISGLICLAPFFTVIWGLITWYVAVIFASIVGFVMLFLLGIFLGRVSDQNQWLYGLQTVMAGVSTAVAIILLEIFI